MSNYYQKTTMPTSVRKQSIQEQRGFQNYNTDPISPTAMIPPVVSPTSQILSTFQGGWTEKKKPLESNRFNYFFNTFKNMQAIEGIDLGEFEPLTAKPKVIKKPEKPQSNLIKAAQIYKSGKFKTKHKEARWPDEFQIVKTVKTKNQSRNPKETIPALLSASSQKKRSSVSTEVSKQNQKSILGLYSCRASQETELKLMQRLEQKPQFMIRLGREKRHITPVNKKTVGMSGRQIAQSQYHHAIFKNTTPLKSRIMMKTQSPKGSSGSPPKSKENRDSIEQWQKFRINQNIDRAQEKPITTIQPKKAQILNKGATTRRQQLTHHIQQRRKQEEIRKAALQEEIPSVDHSVDLKIGGERQPLHLRMKSPKAYEKPQNDDLYQGSKKLVHQEEFGEYFLSGIMGKDMLEPHKLQMSSPQMIEEEGALKRRKNSKERVKKRRGSFGAGSGAVAGQVSQKRDISTARGTTRDNSTKRDSAPKENTSKVAMKWGFNYKNDILTGSVGEEQALDMISGWN